jgi:hypothetical protein
LSSTRIGNGRLRAAEAVPGVVWDRRRLPRLTRETLWPLALYAFLAVLLFGLPVVAHPKGTIIGADEIDPSQFMWFYTWWPWALLNGVDPFVTYYQFVPDGFNLQWAASMPLFGLLFAPITLGLGPELTWNAVMLASPALAAWTGFLLCRQVTGRLAPSLIGGYVFGFSPYMLGMLTGAPNLAFVALVPVFVLLVLRRLEGSLSPRRFLVAMAAAFIAQFLISTEVLLTSTVFGAAALAIAFVMFPERRRAILDVVGLLFVAGAAMAIVVSPFLVSFFFGEHHPPVATYFSTDLAAFALPPHAVALTTTHDPLAALRGSVTTTYLGLPLIILIGAFLWQGRRSRVAWFAVLFLLVPAIASLGRGLRVRGELTDIWLPWDLVADLPVLKHALSVRFALFVTLAAAVIVSMWLSPGGAARWVPALLVVASILPAVGNSVWRTDIRDPAFFATGEHRDYLESDDHVITIPVLGPNERWQAKAKLGFKLAGGYLGTRFPDGYTRYPTWHTLLTGRLTRDYALELRRFVRAKGVTAIVVDKGYEGPWTKLFGTLGVRPVDTGGVLFYRLPPPGGS